MKNIFRVSFFLLLITLCVSDLSAQAKEYGNVYYSIKNGDTWSGLTKMNAKAFLEKSGKGFDYPVTVRLIDKGTNYYYVNCKFEAKTADGKSFHKLESQGPGMGSSEWMSPSGSTEINWVYLNKSIHEIYDSEIKPFDLELHFEDGSAVKYFFSPSY